MSALVTVSGGIDSVVLGHWARGRGYDGELWFFDHGQPNVQRELSCAQALSEDLGWPLSVCGLRLSLPAGAESDRAFALGIAAEYAIGRGHEAVLVGMIGDDRGVRPHLAEFLSSFALATREMYARWPAELAFRIEAPLLDLGKAQVLRLGAELGVDFARSWSCNVRTDVPCGECRGCVERTRGFAEAGLHDALAPAA